MEPFQYRKNREKGGSMIKQVYNLNEKSFRNYNGPDKGFKEKNIIFGYNGRGKSSLAKGLIREFLKDTANSSENYRFFNRNYIKENIILKESNNSKIKGVIANFGKKDVDIEKQIKLLEENIIDTKELENEIQQLNKNIRAEIDKIHDEKKGSISIQKKPMSKTNQEVILLYNEDITKAKNIEDNEDKLIEYKGDDSLGKQKLKLENINIPNIDFIDNNQIIKIKDIFNKTYNDIEIPSSKVIEWIFTGLSIHNEGDRCKFCGGTPNLEFIKSNVEKYNKNEKQIAATQLNEFKIKLEKLILQIENLLSTKDSIVSALENNSISKEFNIIQENKEVIIEFKDIIINKIENIKLQLNFDDKRFTQILNDIEKSYKEIVMEKKKQIEIINNKISKLNILIKGAIGLEIRKNTYINSNMELVNKKQKILRETINKIKIT